MSSMILWAYDIDLMSFVLSFDLVKFLTKLGLS